MSAAAQLPKPEPEPTPGSSSDADGWALLESLRRRLDDQGAQGRKTALQVSQLAESIGSLVELQRRRARSLNLNSFVAYLIFTVLCGTGFYLLYRSRAGELAAARDGAVSERDAATKRADDATGKLAARDAADARAWEVYQLVEAGKHREAADQLAALADQPLSRTERAVLAARAHDTAVIAVEAALKAATAAIKTGHHADIVAPLEAALVTETTGARAAQMHYLLGVAFAKLGDLVKARTQLDAAIAAEVEQEDARFQLASVLDRSGAFGPARAEYDRFATAHPQSPLAVFAMRRSATLARTPAPAPSLAPVAPKMTAPAPQPSAPAAVPEKSGAIAPASPTPPATLPRPVAAPVAIPVPAPQTVPQSSLDLVPGKPTPPVAGELAPVTPRPPVIDPLPPVALQPMDAQPEPAPPPREPLPPLPPAPRPPSLPVPPSPEPFDDAPAPPPREPLPPVPPAPRPPSLPLPPSPEPFASS